MADITESSSGSAQPPQDDEPVVEEPRIMLVSDVFKQGTPEEQVRRLMRVGVDRPVAIRLLAEFKGVPVISGDIPIDWEVEEITKMLFMRDLAERGEYDDDL